MQIKALIKHRVFYENKPHTLEYICVLVSWKNGRTWWKIQDVYLGQFPYSRANFNTDEINIFLDSKKHKLGIFGNHFPFKEWHLNENDPNI